MNGINKYKILAGLIFQCSLTLCIAQSTVGGRNAGGIDVTDGPGGTIQQINRAPNSKIMGTKYLNTDWQKGDIEEINGGRVEGVLLRYDVEQGSVELFQKDSTVKALHDSKIKKVIIYSANSDINQILLNGGDFKLNGVHVFGLVDSEELVGKYNIITRYWIKKSDPTYNVVLDTGNEESKIEVSETIYLTESHNLIELPKNKKKLINLLSDTNTDLIRSFIKTNNISVKQYKDLVTLVGYVNSLNEN